MSCLAHVQVVAVVEQCSSDDIPEFCAMHKVMLGTLVSGVEGGEPSICCIKSGDHDIGRTRV